MNIADTAAAAERRAWVDVDLAAIVANARRVAESAAARLVPMIKANGYGLGAVPIARALEAVDPWGFGVATIGEAAELRAAQVERAILLFTPILAEQIEAARALRVTPVICDIAALRCWVEGAPGLAFHIGIDTGMARAGIPYDDRAALAAARDLVSGRPGYEGICTHFHSAEDDPAATARQWDRLHDTVAALGPRPPLVHAANSAAALAGPRLSGDLVRPGIFLYGGRAGPHEPAAVARFQARVVATRTVRQGESVSYGATWSAPHQATIATVAAGYADGIPRALSGKGVVEIDGRRCPIRGRVTMDMTLVETSEPVDVGAVATIFGGLVSLDEQATAAGTISYELLTRLSDRVKRRYTG